MGRITSCRHPPVLAIIILVLTNIYVHNQFAILDNLHMHDDQMQSHKILNNTVKVYLERRNKVTFLLVLGVEGTGHHLFSDLYNKSVFNKNKVNEVLNKYPIPVFNGIDKSQAIWSAPCSLDKQPNGTILLQEFINRLQKVDSELANTEGVVVPLNGIFIHGHEEMYGGYQGMGSYGMLSGDCKVLQYPDVDLTYAACATAGVECKHIVVYRDPYSVIRSTTMKRHFSSTYRQIKLMTTMLDVLNTHILSHQDELYACWNYNQGIDSEQTRNIGNLLGWDTEDFIDIYSNLFIKSEPLTDKQRKVIIPPELQPFMDTMVRSMERVKNNCLSVLDVNENLKKK